MALIDLSKTIYGNPRRLDRLPQLAGLKRAVDGPTTTAQALRSLLGEYLHLEIAALAENSLFLSDNAGREVKVWDLGDGLVKASSGVGSVAVADVDYLTPGGVASEVATATADMVTRTSAAGAANELLLSAGASRVLASWALGAGIVKVNGSGVGSVAVADTDYSTPSGVSSAISTATSNMTTRTSAAGAANEIVVSSAADRTLKTWTAGSGLVKVSSGVGSVAVANTDYTDPTGLAAAILAAFPFQSISADTTLTMGGYIKSVLIDASTNTVEVTLPSAATLTGKTFILTVTDTSVFRVTVTPDGAETINDVTEIWLLAQDSMSIISDGSNWRIN